MAVLEVGDKELFDREILGASEATVVAFWAEWCPFCRRFREHFERAASVRRGRFAIVRLDDEDNPLWERYAVSVVPSIAMFRGGVIAARRDGVLGRGITPGELERFLNEVLPSRTLHESP